MYGIYRTSNRMVSVDGNVCINLFKAVAPVDNSISKRPPRHDESCPKIKCQKAFNEFLEACISNRRVRDYIIHTYTYY